MHREPSTNGMSQHQLCNHVIIRIPLGRLPDRPPRLFEGATGTVVDKLWAGVPFDRPSQDERGHHVDAAVSGTRENGLKARAYEIC